MGKAPKAKKQRKIPKVRWFSDHETFHANFIGYMSLAMALCQIPYILVIFLLMVAKKDMTMAMLSFIFVPFIAIMLWFGVTRSKMMDALPQTDRATVVAQRDHYFRQLLRIQTVSVAILIILFGVAFI